MVRGNGKGVAVYSTESDIHAVYSFITRLSDASDCFAERVVQAAQSVIGTAESVI